MIIETITIEGFKSIYNKTTFDFTEKGMWKVSGDVGSGKTTIGQAIIFCLFGSVTNVAFGDLISWGAKKCVADIDLISLGKKIHIHRVIYKNIKRKTELDIIIDGEPLQYTNKRDGQQILESVYFDISRQAVESLCIISFNGLKNITNFNLSYNETRDFVDDIFGLGIINNYINKIKDFLNSSQTEQTRLQTEIDLLKKQKSAAELKLQDITCSETNEDLNKLNNDKESLNEKHIELTSEYSRQTGILKPLKESLANDLAVIKSKGVQLSKNLDMVKQGKCPVCGSTVEPELIEQYNTEISELRAEYASKNKELNNLTEQITNCTYEYNKSIAAIDKDIKNIEYNINKIKFSRQNETDTLKTNISAFNTEINTKNELLNTVNVEVAEWKQIYDILYKDGRSSILKVYIGPLNQNINFYLRELKQPYTVRFDENFKCSINAFGANDIPVSSLSTGQEKTVNTAIIFGILKTLLNGVNFNVIFLDELICNMHEELRNVTCEMIVNNIKGKSIYIISHTPVDESIFTGEIKARLNYWEEDGMLIQNTEYTKKMFNK